IALPLLSPHFGLGSLGGVIGCTRAAKSRRRSVHLAQIPFGEPTSTLTSEGRFRRICASCTTTRVPPSRRREDTQGWPHAATPPACGRRQEGIPCYSCAAHATSYRATCSSAFPRTRRFRRSSGRSSPTR